MSVIIDDRGATIEIGSAIESVRVESVSVDERADTEDETNSNRVVCRVTVVGRDGSVSGKLTASEAFNLSQILARFCR